VSYLNFGKDSIRELSTFFSSRDKLAFFYVLLVSLLLSAMDLIGIMLIGVISSISITGIATGQVGDRVNYVLSFLNLEDLDLERQVIVIGIIASVALMSKTMISMFLVRKSMFFMARKSALVSAALVNKFFTIPVSEINQRTAQASIFSLTDGVTRIMVGVVGAGLALISDLILLLILSLGLFLIDPITALLTSVIFVSLALLMYFRMHKKVATLGAQVGFLNIDSSQRIFEAITCYRELIVRNRRNFFAKKIGDLRLSLADKVATISYMTNLSKYLMEIAVVVGAILVATYQFSNYTAFRAIATITIFLAASTRIVPAILRVQQGILGMKTAVAEAGPTINLIRDLSARKTSLDSISSFTTSHPNFVPELEIEGVTFSYRSAKNVLNNVSLSASSGEFIAIVGNSGAGKTTLVDILLGALVPESGSVKISGLRPEMAFLRWPGAVAYVPQDSPTINGTIRENLILGYESLEVPENLLWESLRIAQLKDFVLSLQDKLESTVGDRGTSLSGGQRQRLGIARALVTNPALLILDEATSSLDGATELEVSESLRGLKGSTTLVVIAHRLSTVIEADRLYYLDNGQITAMGNFSELKRKEPKFREQARLMGL
jgi:ABC-type multidrug transport system fused ATPase/permease subunit